MRLRTFWQRKKPPTTRIYRMVDGYGGNLSMIMRKSFGLEAKKCPISVVMWVCKREDVRDFVRMKLFRGNFGLLARFSARVRGRACGCVFYISLYIRRVIGTLFTFLTGYGRDLAGIRRVSCGFNRFGSVFPVSNVCSDIPYYGGTELTYFYSAGCWTSLFGNPFVVE